MVANGCADEPSLPSLPEGETYQALPASTRNGRPLVAAPLRTTLSVALAGLAPSMLGTSAMIAVAVSDSVVSVTAVNVEPDICTVSPAAKPAPPTSTTPPTGASPYVSELTVGRFVPVGMLKSAPPTLDISVAPP